MMAVDEWYYLEWVVYIQLLLGHLFMPRTGPRQGGMVVGRFPRDEISTRKNNKKGRTSGGASRGEQQELNQSWNSTS